MSRSPADVAIEGRLEGEFPPNPERSQFRDCEPESMGERPLRTAAPIASGNPLTYFAEKRRLAMPVALAPEDHCAVSPNFTEFKPAEFAKTKYLPGRLGNWYKTRALP
jgi:hypothetical protein